MPKAGNSVYRKSLFRRTPYPNLPERAPLPDLVALYENGTLFSNPRAMVERITEEEVAQSSQRTPRSKVNATEPHPHPRTSNLESQAEEDKNKPPNSESGHGSYLRLPEDKHRTYPPTPSNPHPDIQHNHSPSVTANPSTQTKSISPHSLRQRGRGLPDLCVITSPTCLAELKNKNMSNTFRKLPPIESKQSEQKNQEPQTHQKPRFQNPVFESQTQGNNYRGQETEYHSHNNRNHPDPNPPRQQGKIRLRTDVPPNTRTLYSLGSESPDSSQNMTNPNSSPVSNPGTISPRPIDPSTLSPSPPQLLPRPLSNPITSIQYTSAILSLRASTRNPQHFPLPPGIHLLENLPQQKMKKKKEKEQNIKFLALQMEQVEDAIRLEGAPAEAREVYYAQFARGEY